MSRDDDFADDDRPARRTGGSFAAWTVVHVQFADGVVEKVSYCCVCPVMPAGPWNAGAAPSPWPDSGDRVGTVRATARQSARRPSP